MAFLAVSVLMGLAIISVVGLLYFGIDCWLGSVPDRFSEEWSNASAKPE